MRDASEPYAGAHGRLVVSPELKSVPAESEKITYAGPIKIWLAIMQALGIPGELLAENARDLLSVSNRESDVHRARLPSG